MPRVPPPLLSVALAFALATGVFARGGGPRLRALLVGCSEYPFLREALGDERYEREVRLNGPVADVELVRATLGRVLGLEPAHARVLAGWPAEAAARPTRANVLAALAALADEVGPGDRAVVFLAGHGTQQRVPREKSDEPDGLDEVFLPADARTAQDGWIPNSIRDDELGAAVRAIRDAGADVWLIVDACHSGTMLRGAEEAGVRVRGLDPALLGIPSEPRGGARSSRRASEREESWMSAADSTRIAALYGAQSYGRAPEMPTPRGTGEVHGLFSWILCQELERTGGHATYQELSDRIVAAYQAFPCSITIPGAEGDLAREVASGAEVEGPRLLCTLRSGTPWLNQGRLAGIEAGSVAALIADSGSERVLARVEVVESQAFEARCRWLDEERDPRLATASAFPAEIERRAGSDWRLALALLDAKGAEVPLAKAPEALREVLAAESERFPLGPREAADWWIVLDEEGGFRLRPGAREGGFDLFEVSPATLAADLRRIQTTRNLRRCSGDLLTAGWGKELDVWVERKPPHGRAHRLQPGETVHPLDQIRILLAKSSARIFDVHVFYLDAGFRRVRLFPRSGATPRLEAEAQKSLELTSWLTVVDDGLGLEQVLVLATPREPASPVLDLAWLEQEGTLRGTAGGPLEGLLAGLQRGENLRGQSFGADAEVEGTQSLLVGLRTDWRALAAPAWPRGEARTFAPDEGASSALFPQALPPGVPDPWRAGTRVALVRSEAAGREADTLLLGDADVRAVWLDLDGDSESVTSEGGAELVARRRAFDAEVAYLFADDGRYAFYDSRATGRLDLVLVDRDGDGVAEERHLLEGERWHTWRGVALPWSSQAHLPRGLGGKSEERAARLALLQAED